MIPSTKSLISVAASFIAALALAGCDTKPAASPAAPAASAPSTGPASASDIAYCNKLASRYDEYGIDQRRSGGEVDVGIAEAMNECHSGNPQAGIATLEGKLKEQRISLPPR